MNLTAPRQGSLAEGDTARSSPPMPCMLSVTTHLPGPARCPLRADRQAQPARPALPACPPALAGRPGRLSHASERGHGRAEPRTVKVTAVAHELVFPQGRPGHPDHAPPQGEGEMVAGDLLRGHLAHHHPGQPHSARRHHRRPTGASKTACTGSATWPPAKTARRSTASGPHIVASLRNLVITIAGSPEPPASPPCGTTPGGPAGHYERS